jgi:hypothetical protein
MDWKQSTVAPDGTHHVLSGKPFYPERFEEVLSFHEPGLASVNANDQGWHIRVDGTPAYQKRYTRTFGFYEGVATVTEDGQWFHISPKALPIYKKRYAWCGNFQEGRCTVRLQDGSYRHIGLTGKSIGENSWRYAGDYRHGIAVVQNDAGQSTHIDYEGNLLHGKWFHDLDVFHKGFARGRDEAGWHHINLNGNPIYSDRFAMVEPFYNGQARVERFDGGLEVIDETGKSIAELRRGLLNEQ